MKVTVKQRTLKDGMISLYLNIYHDGRKTREALQLYLHPDPKTQLERRENRMNLELAERLKADRVIELQDQSYGLYRKTNGTGDFIQYFESQAEQRKSSIKNYGNWKAAILHFKRCFGNHLPIKDMNLDVAKRFKYYLQYEAKTKSHVLISQNTRHSYFNKFKACLNSAFEDRLIAEKITDYIKGFKMGETHREYLTFDELQTLIETPCRYSVLKRAFIFSCLTGIRWSDIQKMVWSDVRPTTNRGIEIAFTQSKTKGVEYLPISTQAEFFLGERSRGSDRVFEGLKYSANMNIALLQWVLSAKIDKHITFHCARHTNAVLLLENGADIYTVSKLLGHKHVSTTQVYAKIVDRKKVEAVNSIPKLSLF